MAIKKLINKKNYYFWWCSWLCGNMTTVVWEDPDMNEGSSGGYCYIKSSFRKFLLLLCFASHSMLQETPLFHASLWHNKLHTQERLLQLRRHLHFTAVFECRLLELSTLCQSMWLYECHHFHGKLFWIKIFKK